ncbi:hypothetical protein [Sporomusa termitida]|nr:hypothetical protein [Sporomusa termitida]
MVTLDIFILLNSIGEIGSGIALAFAGIYGVIELSDIGVGLSLLLCY